MYKSSIDSVCGNFVSSDRSEIGDPDDSMDGKGSTRVERQPAKTREAMADSQTQPKTADQVGQAHSKSWDMPTDHMVETEAKNTERGVWVEEACNRRKQCRDVSCFNVNQDLLGSGTYGQVRIAYDKETGEKVALKKPDLKGDTNGLPITSVREIKALQAVGAHPNLVQLKEIVTSKATDHNRQRGDVYMVFEYAPYDLRGIVDKVRNLSLSHVRCYIYQLLEGLAALHSHGYVHRDLKGANILVTEDHVVKIADLGLVKNIKGYEKSERQLTSKVCTLWYRAPEQIMQKQYYNGKADLWAVGVILAELLNHGKPIWSVLPSDEAIHQWKEICKLCGTPTLTTWPGVERQPAFRTLRVGHYERKLKHRFAHADPEAVDLLDKLLVLDPEQRISVDEALDHSFLWKEGKPDPSKLPRFEFDHAHELESRKANRAPEANHNVQRHLNVHNSQARPHGRPHPTEHRGTQGQRSYGIHSNANSAAHHGANFKRSRPNSGGEGGMFLDNPAHKKFKK